MEVEDVVSIEDAKDLIEAGVGVIQADKERLMKLLRFASIALYGGGAPRTCVTSLKKYYLKLKELDMFKKAEPNKSKCVANFVTKFHPEGGHYYASNLSDAKAAHALKMGYLKEEDFKVLPDGAEPKETEESLTRKLEAAKSEVLRLHNLLDQRKAEAEKAEAEAEKAEAEAEKAEAEAEKAEAEAEKAEAEAEKAEAEKKTRPDIPKRKKS